MNWLFSPIRIGSLELKNRIVFPAMATGYATEEGYITQQAIDYYVARGKGGTGFIIVEPASVHPNGRMLTQRHLCLFDDKYVPKMGQLVDVVHQTSAKIAIQLYHGWKAYSVVDSYDDVLVNGLSHKALEELTLFFCNAAKRAKTAGFDAIEIQSCHTSFLARFLSPHWNKRTDEYGGTLENRVRLHREIVKQIKQRVDLDFPIICRLNGEERIEKGGLTVEDCKQAALILQEVGADAFHISVGPANSRLSGYIPPMDVRPGSIVPLATAVKSVVSVPVISVGRINSAGLAEKILEEGRADLIAMGRALIADPELPNKAARGEKRQVVQCIACNEGCHSTGITCLCNPRVGHEMEPELAPNQVKSVVIVGGGPAGLQAAYIAASRGHKVSLYEKKDKLGGQLRLASIPPNRHGYEYIIRHLASETRRAGVKIELGITVTPSLLKELIFDAVILATGSRPWIPDWSGVNGENVIVAHDVLGQPARVGQKVLVLGGGLIGLETADFLRQQGRTVTVLEALESVGRRILPEASQATFLLDRLERGGVQILMCSRIKELIGDGVVIDNEGREELVRDFSFLQSMRGRIDGFALYKDAVDENITGFDTIVLALGSVPENQLAVELKEVIAEFHVIGDARRPGRALDAVVQGRLVGYDI